MQWLYVFLATFLTFAGLIYVDNNRRRDRNEEPTSTAARIGIFFSLLLLFFSLFYWFDDSVAGDESKQSLSSKGGAVRIPEVSRVQRIPEDCHDGVPPF